MRFHTLAEWLNWQETLHPSLIELGLERVNGVFLRLQDGRHPPFQVITIAGTNGKGSSVALLDAILRSAGYRTGVYTSPHLLRYNERVCINGEQVSDADLMDAFQRIDTARADISLTYFEFGTLAALDIFYRNPLDVVILEVGLGGRLDAVNIIDADVALITSIGLDHTDWLGPDRESIAREKAGIMRRGKPVVCSDPAVPHAIKAVAAELAAPLYCLGEAFTAGTDTIQLTWRGPHDTRLDLPLPGLRGPHQINNTAGVLMVVELLQESLPITRQQLRQGMLSVQPPRGRQQILTEPVLTVLDVAHNVDSVAALADVLRSLPCTGKTIAVTGILADKDLPGIFSAIHGMVDEWHLADLHVPRGAQAVVLQDALRRVQPDADTHCYADVVTAWRTAGARTESSDRLVVFGSFYTVAEVLAQGV
ncbi:MAG: bifunctional tetrahydrofolate synthase/dihydrofolate synthase [Gammaproteobacteria bacterium]|nr:bifunctional tetrahydrofolate synthase/dihydrofolate synthase [Gammaproteobacteria bacterium]